MSAPASYEFWDILKKVSRSFYLTLYFLPAPTRRLVALAYLLARAADTVADTPLIERDQRLQFLGKFRGSLLQRHRHGVREVPSLPPPPHLPALPPFLTDPSLADERRLLDHLPQILDEFSSREEADRDRVYRVLDVIVSGMEWDLTHFPGEDSNCILALDSYSEMDRYCYMVAGVVGEFWTEVHQAHLPSLQHWGNEHIQVGIRFGKALQMTNILRDIPSDLHRGRCYIPKFYLDELGLSPADLLHTSRGYRFKPVMDELLSLAVGHYRAGIHYLLEIPPSEFRLRLACILPLLIGVLTLGLLLKNPNPLDPRPQKIRRKQVYRLLANALPLVASNQWTANYFRKLFRQNGLHRL